MSLLTNALQKLNAICKMSYYAVARGRQIGIFDTWAKCEEQVKGFKAAKYKKFPTRQEAQRFVDAANSTVVANEKKSYKRKAEQEEHIKDFWPETTTPAKELTDNDLISVAALVETSNQSKTTKNTHNKNKAPDLAGAAAAKKYKPSDNVFRHRSKIWHPVDICVIGNYQYHVDEEGYVICYTDGSCVNNGKKGAYAGYGVYFADDHPLNAAKPVKGRATNNVGEIQAANYAIQTAINVGIKKLCLSTDSQFLLNSAISWITGWKRNNWRLKDGGPVKNADEFKVLDNLLQNNAIIVKWNYVKAHVGVKGNEMADQLAKAGAEMYRNNKKH